MDGVVALFLMAIVLFAYFIPAIAALGNKHPQAGAIGLLNLLLGWTLLGWVGALVWAVTVPTNAPHPKPPETAPKRPPPVSGPTKTCPHCISKIPIEATVCRVCKRDLAARKDTESDDDGNDEPNYYDLG